MVNYNVYSQKGGDNMREMRTLSDTLGVRTYKYHLDLRSGERIFRECFRGLRVKNDPKTTELTGELIVD